MYISGPLSGRASWNQYVVVMKDRYYEQIWAGPTSKMSATHMVSILLGHWIVAYGIPALFSTYNGTKFLSELFETVCYFFGLKNLSTIVYHPGTSGQAEWYHETLTTSRLHDMAEYQRVWGLSRAAARRCVQKQYQLLDCDNTNLPGPLEKSAWSVNFRPPSKNSNRYKTRDFPTRTQSKDIQKIVMIQEKSDGRLAAA